MGEDMEKGGAVHKKDEWAGLTGNSAEGWKIVSPSKLQVASVPGPACYTMYIMPVGNLRPGSRDSEHAVLWWWIHAGSYFLGQLHTKAGQKNATKIQMM